MWPTIVARSPIGDEPRSGQVPAIGDASTRVRDPNVTDADGLRLGSRGEDPHEHHPRVHPEHANVGVFERK